MLGKGDLFSYYEGEPGVFEVMRVTPCGATIRPTTKVRVVILDPITGEEKVAFDKPRKPSVISVNSMVKVVKRGGEPC